MLQQDLQEVFEWAETNNMLFNSKKFDMETTQSWKTPQTTSQILEQSGTQIQEKITTRDLGVIISSTADFKTHIKTLAETVCVLSSWILRSFKSRSKTVLLQLWKSLVIPRLDYCSQLWNPHHVYLINQLEELQKSFIRNIEWFKEQTIPRGTRGARSLFTPEGPREISNYLSMVDHRKSSSQHRVAGWREPHFGAIFDWRKNWSENKNATLGPVKICEPAPQVTSLPWSPTLIIHFDKI